MIDWNYEGPVLITNGDIDLINNKSKKFEEQMSNYYPLTDTEQFRLDHGKIYSKFFDRMGKLHTNVCYDREKNLIATGSGVLRNINNNKIWYICDLKIDKKYRGRHIPFHMFMNSLHLAKLSNKAYGITMNNSNDKNNKVVKLAKKIKSPIGGFAIAGTLLIYSLNSKDMLIAKPIIESIKGPIFFVNLRNIKDIILKSTNKPMNLCHVNLLKNAGNCKYYKDQVTYQIDVEYTYMFCFHKDDIINKKLNASNINTNITATIIHHNLDDLTPDNYDFIQTSEI